MKHSIAVKFIALFLCALSLVTIAASGAGILYLEEYNLYNEPLSQRRDNELRNIAQMIATYEAERYAAETLGNCPAEILSDILVLHSPNVSYCATVMLDGTVLRNVGDAITAKNVFSTTIPVFANYPVLAYQYTIGEDGSYATEVPASEDAESKITAQSDEQNDAPVLYIDRHVETYWDEYGTRHQVGYVLNYYSAPMYEVSVWLDQASLFETEFAFLSLIYGYRDAFIPLLLAALLLFAAMLVYLCAAAGHTKNGGIRPAGLNRLPLDLYLIGAVSVCVVLGALVIVTIENYANGYHGIWDNLPLCLMIIGLGAFLMALLGIGLLFAFAAQLKVGSGYWWRHSLCGWCLARLMDLLRRVRSGLRYVCRGICAVVRMLPVIWQWLLTAALMALSVSVSGIMAVLHWQWEGFWLVVLLLCLLGCIAIVCYGGWCFGILLKGVKAMSRGELNHQVPTQYLHGIFRDAAVQLNSLAGAAQLAAQRQMRSERMKTELITNVSHDIKTPLTSIINYVDLLKKPHSDAEGAQYLDVLDRQSQRLKKLIDDLMEMSKASTGNITVEFGEVDAVEAVNQAIGEFADKLDRVGLVPVFRHPEFPVLMRADGKLVWRVLSNILGNTVKYAMPNTRLYIDLMVLQGNAVIAVKNISREQLNVGADELMERFVRGDSSRNTEGSGLGLNIAKSLVELQGGQMHLMVDGDLFKVTLIFPCI